MAESKHRTISYKRAEYFIEKPGSIRLSACVKAAVDKRTTVQSRTIARGRGQYIRLADCRADEHKGIYLHLTLDTPGDFASIVPQVPDTAVKFDVRTAQAPPNTEFMDGDAFVYIRGNDLCICTTALTIAAVHYFLQQFLAIANIRHDAASFDLQNAADTKKLAVIAKHGVKEIELKATLQRYALTHSIRKNKPLGIMGPLWKYFKGIVAADNDVSQDALRVALTLTVDGRVKKGITLGYKRINEIAVKIVEDQQKGDEYVIVTNDGLRISPTDIILKGGAEIEALGKSVNREKAWTELINYYNSLKGTGAFEE